MPAILNAANEIAVASFLDGEIRFTAIPDVIKHAMDTVDHLKATDIDAVLEADSLARRVAEAYISQLT